jgi:FkbM family methyltransferase
MDIRWLVLNRIGKFMIVGNYKIFRKNELDNTYFNRRSPLLTLINSDAEGLVIFDVGANTGQTLVEFKTLFPMSTVHCFEPIDGPFRQLKQKCELFTHSHAHQLALSDKCGEREFYVNKQYSPSSGFIKVNAKSLSVIRNTHVKDMLSSGDSVFKKTKVLTSTLDEFCYNEGISKISLLKLDTQGAETTILRGGGELLKSGLVDIILTEISLDDIYDSRPSFGKIEEIIGPHGFSLWDISHIYKDLKIGRTCWVDAIYVHERIIRDISERA